MIRPNIKQTVDYRVKEGEGEWRIVNRRN